MPSRWPLLILLTPLALPCPAADPKHNRIEIPPVKTSIYIGSVTLTTAPLVREGGSYVADYKASVFPYFFYNEHGRFWINISDEQLAQFEKLAPGERLAFSGHGKTSDGDERRIEGHAERTDATSGKIKVRLFVTKKIQLIFNTTYRLTGE